MDTSIEQACVGEGNKNVSIISGCLHMHLIKLVCWPKLSVHQI